jgi:nicotinamide mononucleotide transporter
VSWYEHVTAYLGMSWVELLATLFGLACVALYVVQNVWSWPTGLVQVCLYVWVFFQARLYSDALLQLVYIVLQLYGWYHWVRGRPGNDQELPISRLTRSGWVLWLTVAAGGALGLGYVMHRYTDAALPYWDALIVALSLAAQYLIARKVLENWILWWAVDVLGVGVYFAKGLYLTTALYAVFLGMAIAGWLAWRRSYRMQPIRTPDGLEAVVASSSASSSHPTAGTSS